MKAPKRNNTPEKLLSEIHLARLQLAKADSQLRSAKEQARLAKRRRKEAREVARLAKKRAKLAKRELAEAKAVLTKAEEKLAQAARTATRAKAKKKAAASTAPKSPKSDSSPAKRAGPLSGAKPRSAAFRDLGIARRVAGGQGTVSTGPAVEPQPGSSTEAARPVEPGPQAPPKPTT